MDLIVLSIVEAIEHESYLRSVPPIGDEASLVIGEMR